MNDEQDTVGGRLGRSVRALREERGWSQDRLAEELGDLLGKEIRGLTVLRLEKGSRPTSVDELVALSELFRVSPLALLATTPEDEAVQHMIRRGDNALEEFEAALVNVRRAASVLGQTESEGVGQRNRARMLSLLEQLNDVLSDNRDLLRNFELWERKQAGGPRSGGDDGSAS